VSRPQFVMLADLGEGLEEAFILEFLVEPGAQVKRLEPLLTVETDKAAVEVTSPWQGTLTRFLVASGEYVKVGSPLAEIDADD
jgi:2-oxoisovalerate dehydrogenase E2 component (dihydrolipoyl transacylase)